MKINYSVIVVLFFSFTSCTIYLNHRAKKNGLEGHFDKDYNWHQSPNMAYVSEREFLSVQKKFDSIPTITIELEKTRNALKEHCYKFIYNKDSTKFVALYVVNQNDSSYKTSIEKRDFWTIYTDSHKKENDNLYYGYWVWGMKQNNIWYYSRDYWKEKDFYCESDAVAKKEFLYYTLSKYDYFKRKFWLKGEFSHPHERIWAYEKYKKYANVVWRSKHMDLENIAGSIKSLIKADSSTLNKYHTFILYSDTARDNYYQELRYNALISNWDNTIILKPIAYNQKNEKFWTLVLYDFRQDRISTYLWKKNIPINHRASPFKSQDVSEYFKTIGIDWNGWDNYILDETFWKTIIDKNGEIIDSLFIKLN